MGWLVRRGCRGIELDPSARASGPEEFHELDLFHRPPRGQPRGMDQLPITDRTRLRRRPQRASVDRAMLDAILDEGLVIHVGFATEAGPFVIPTSYVRVGRELFIHGSPAARTLKLGTDG